jgi:CBS domain-containing protein
VTPQRHPLTAPPEAMDDDPLISSVMTPHVVAVTPDSPLRTGMHLMAANNLRHLPVIEGSRCLGAVLEIDIVRAVAIGGPSLLGPLVRALPMVSANERRSTAARAMLAGDVDAVLVTDGSRLVGIITTTDLVRSLAGRAQAPRS